MKIDVGDIIDFRIGQCKSVSRGIVDHLNESSDENQGMNICVRLVFTSNEFLIDAVGQFIFICPDEVVHVYD